MKLDHSQRSRLIVYFRRLRVTSALVFMCQLMYWWMLFQMYNLPCDNGIRHIGSNNNII